MYENNTGNYTISANEKKKPKRNFGSGKKVVTYLLLGILFGASAGGSFFTIKTVYDFLPVKQTLESVAGKLGIEGYSTPEASEEPTTVTPGATVDGSIDGDIPGTQTTPDIQAVEALSSASVLDVSNVAQAVMPSIVSINTKVDYNYYGYEQEASASGSGIIVGQNDTELLLVTNYHVIEDGKEISVQFCDGKAAVAKIKGKNVSMDVAVIAVPLSEMEQSTQDAIKVATLGDSDALKVGEPAIAIGNALGYGQSVTTGVISALNRELTLGSGEKGSFIQTDAAINPGNSGGALLNLRGQVIGINSNKLGGTVVEGMGYAIPISAAEPIMEELMNKQELVALPENEQSYFGISGTDVPSNTMTPQGVVLPKGIYVAQVFDDSPAQQAGIVRGDIITEFDGDSITSMDELKKYLAAYPAGTTVTITFKRMINYEYVEQECQVVLQNKSELPTQ